MMKPRLCFNAAFTFRHVVGAFYAVSIVWAEAFKGPSSIAVSLGPLGPIPAP